MEAKSFKTKVHQIVRASLQFNFKTLQKIGGVDHILKYTGAHLENGLKTSNIKLQRERFNTTD